ncbi:hypothetical protein N825_10675 [Skermanella stibiiresistens SB22]|uniref:Uncharacterized protein n=1 Tax=Skermanella stibiiresistens SB22 TaxID=1385369 RepID=W9H5D1_9PROT|nr:hypothetical protein [Skermanella stibiiresistens]EWY38968.1 hypothetical protein N825_10675 [Skermanella stibiiresistens SB22]
MPDRTSVDVSVEYEMHMLQDGAWQPAVEAPAASTLLKAAEKVLALRGLDGVRVVRATAFKGFDHTERTIIVKWVGPGRTDPDPLGVPMLGGRTRCLARSDFHREQTRDEIRVLLARFLEPRRLTPLELIHSVRHTTELASGKGMVEGAIQRVALAQVQGEKDTSKASKARYIELINAVHKAIEELHADDRKYSVPQIEAGRFLAVAWELESRFPDEETFSYHCLRGLTRYLIGASNWAEKLSRLMALIQPGLEVRHYKLIDMLAAEIFDAPPLLRELRGERLRTDQTVILLAELHAGCFTYPEGGPTVGLSQINTLMKRTLLPRSRTVLRRRMLNELSGRSALRPEEGLFQEIEAVGALGRWLSEVNAPLGADEEIRCILEQRIGAVLTESRITSELEALRSQSDRIDRISRLIRMVPGEPDKARLRRHLAGAIEFATLLREMSGGGRKNASDTLEGLIELQTSIRLAGLADEIAAPILRDLDAAAVDTLRNGIMAVKKPLADRIAVLLKICGQVSFPEGRARAFVAETLDRAMKSPDFQSTWSKRFVSEAERKQGMASLQSAIWSVGSPGNAA